MFLELILYVFLYRFFQKPIDYPRKTVIRIILISFVVLFLNTFQGFLKYTALFCGNGEYDGTNQMIRDAYNANSMTCYYLISVVYMVFILLFGWIIFRKELVRRNL